MVPRNIPLLVLAGAGLALLAVAMWVPDAEAATISAFPGTWCDAPKKLRYDYYDSKTGGVTFAWQSLSFQGGAGVYPFPERDDFTGAAAPIGFPFTYFGQSKGNIQMDSNGFVTFQPLVAGSAQLTGQAHYIPHNFPTASAAVNDVIAALWYDWEMSDPSQMLVQNFGGAPNRMAVFEWENAKPSVGAVQGGAVQMLTNPSVGAGLSGNTVYAQTTFEIKLFERDSSIEFHYLSAPNIPNQSGWPRIIGIESYEDAPNGWTGGMSRSAGTSDLSGYAIRFVPVFDAAPTAAGESYAATEDTALTVAGGTQPGALSSGVLSWIANGGLMANDQDELPCVTKQAVLDAAMPASAGTVTVATDGGFTYTPAPDFCGTTSFTYKVKDPATYAPAVTLYSAPATVTLNVACVNDAPAVSLPPAPEATQGAAFTFSGTNLASVADVDAGTAQLRLSVAASSAVGLGSTAGLTANSGSHPGTAWSFTGSLASINAALATLGLTPASCQPVTVEVTVEDLGSSGSGGPRTGMAETEVAVSGCNEVNDPPAASGGGFTLVLGQATKAFTLAGSDPDGDLVTYVIDSPFTLGTVSGTAPDLQYNRGAGTCGEDRMTFHVSDGELDSESVEVVATLLCTVNQPPQAPDMTVSLLAGQPRSFRLEGTDPEGAALTYQVLTQPGQGALTGTAPVLSYVGGTKCATDSFTYQVSDGIDSDTGTVTLAFVCPPNIPPVAADAQYQLQAGASLLFRLFGYDPDDDPLTYQVTAVPSQGLVTGDVPELLFAAPRDVEGVFTLRYRVHDGEAGSAERTVTFTVSAPLPEAVAAPAQAAAPRDSDGDGFADLADNCPATPQPDQADADRDGVGDACEAVGTTAFTVVAPVADTDRDGVPDGDDVCPLARDPLQQDLDRDRIGDACDRDADGDLVPEPGDNCPRFASADQADLDQDGTGDVCDPDDDADGVPEAPATGRGDNCPRKANPSQQDLDGDGLGDACDADVDGSGYVDAGAASPAKARSSSVGGDSGDALSPGVALALGAGCAAVLAAVALLALRLRRAPSPPSP